MISSKLKPLLSLGNKLIGFILFVICAFAIYNKVLQNENLNQYGAELKIQLSKIHWGAWVLMACLMILNYTIEAIKWKTVIAATNQFTIFQALRAVLVGQAFSFFTPARSGDYVGRTLFLAPGTKLKGIAQMAWASYAQLLMTICFGSIALFWNLPFLPWLKWVAPWGAILALFLFFFNQSLKGWLAKLNVLQIPLDLKWKLIALAFSRYLVYLLQYNWAAQMLSIPVNWLDLSIAIMALLFFLSMIPAISLTDLVIRGQLFLLLMAAFYHNDVMLIALTTLIWIVNFLIPSILGAILLLGFKLKR
jgi:putative Ca2+/H+ antiporter (TMEM165/GDT1 family)